MALLVGPRGAAAQTAARPIFGTARAVAAAEVATTRLGGSWIPMAGGSLSFGLTPRIEIGGAARVGLSDATVVRAGSVVRLHFGYAGVRLSVLPAPARWPALRLGLLVGEGNADVKEPALGTLIDSDNGLVIEPSANWRRALLPRVVASADLSWRFASRFALTSAVRSRDVRGPALGLSLSIGPF
ncbi:MAG: hypothetical protein EXR95_01085 [Gemmatimonadetes bacterium]|nr:hypothetical protein [Gemmatimonadota bacterium]